jgi:hypothetical protein
MSHYQDGELIKTEAPDGTVKAPINEALWDVEDPTGRKMRVAPVDAREIVAAGGKYLSGPMAAPKPAESEGQE